MNRIQSRDQGVRLGNRLTDLARKALGQPVEMLGQVADDPVVTRSVLRQVPFYTAYPHSDATFDVADLADKLLHRVPPPRRGGWGAFVKRLVENWPREIDRDPI
jgi:flagellar biosynthesis protein FlhG